MIITIDAGPETKMLEYYAHELEALGLMSKYLYTDIIDCVRVQADFQIEVTYLCADIAFGDYFKFKYQKATECINREDFANTVKTICVALYEILTRRGFYDKEGVFPYEFSKFERGLFYLRGAG